MLRDEERQSVPHRVSAMIGNEQYEHLKKESEAHGYQIALIERWMLIPQNVDDLYAGSLDDADRMMRRPLPSGTRGGGKETVPGMRFLADGRRIRGGDPVRRETRAHPVSVCRRSHPRTGQESRTNPDGLSRMASPTSPSRGKSLDCYAAWKSPLPLYEQ